MSAQIVEINGRFDAVRIDENCNHHWSPPQFIKAAPIGRALRAAGHREFLIHTGQHYDRNMSEIFFEQLEIPEPDLNLGVGFGSHGRQAREMLIRLAAVFDCWLSFPGISKKSKKVSRIKKDLEPIPVNEYHAVNFIPVEQASLPV